MEWVCVNDQLPPLGVEVFVYGIIDPSFDKPLIAGMPKKSIWVNKRIKTSNYTDGNGFMRLSRYGHLMITHWLPIPKLNGKEIFETLPVN